MSDTPNLMTHERIMTGEEYVSYSDYLSLQRERDEARKQNAKLRDIAEWAVDNIFHKCTEDLIRAELEELKQLK